MSNDENPSSDDVVSDEEVAFAVSLWIPIGCGLLLLYLLVLRPLFPSWFLLRPDSRRHLRTSETKNNFQQTTIENAHNNNNKSVDETNGRTRCDWFISLFYPVYEALTLTESDWIKRCGLDVYFTIRLLNLCFGCTLLLSIFNTVVLVPSYRSQPRPESCDAYCALPANESAESDAFRAECVCRWIDQSSMAMVPVRSTTLWLPAVFMFLTSMLVIGLFAREYKRVIRIRKAHQDRKPFFSAYVETDLPSSVPGKVSGAFSILKKNKSTTTSPPSTTSNPSSKTFAGGGAGGASVRPMMRHKTTSSHPTNQQGDDVEEQQQQQFGTTYGSFVRSTTNVQQQPHTSSLWKDSHATSVNEMTNEIEEDNSQQQHLINKQRAAAQDDSQQQRQGEEMMEPREQMTVNSNLSLQFLRARFEELFPGKIHSMHVISRETRHELKMLEKIAKARFRVLVALENALQELADKKQPRPSTFKNFACLNCMMGAKGCCKGGLFTKTRVQPPSSSHHQQQQHHPQSHMQPPQSNIMMAMDRNGMDQLNERTEATEVKASNDSLPIGGGGGGDNDLMTKQEMDSDGQTPHTTNNSNEKWRRAACCCCQEDKKSVAKLEREVEELQVDLDRLNEEFARGKRAFLSTNSIQVERGMDREGSVVSSQRSLVGSGKQNHVIIDHQNNKLPSSAAGFWGGRQLAFVTFKNMAWNEIAMDTLLDHNIRVRLAPAANDIRWGALLGRTKAGPLWSVLRTTLARLLFVVILVFWGTITSAIGAITSVESISQIFPSLKEGLESNPSIVFYLDRFLALIYIILLSLAFPLVQLSTNLESFRISETELNAAVMGRFLLFLVIQVFIFYSVAGTVFKSLVEIANEPTMIVTTLSTTIPKNAAFFLSYMAVQVFNEAIDLTRVLGLLLYVLGEIYSTFCWCAGKPRTSHVRHRRYHACGCCWHFKFPSSFGLAGRNAEICLIFIIAICYSVIQPLVNLSALVYFLFARICFGMQALSTNYQNVDGEGRFWTVVYSGVISGLILAQLTLIGILFVKQGYGPAIFTIVVTLLCTIILTIFVNRTFKRRFFRWSMYDLVQMDEPLLDYDAPADEPPSDEEEEESEINQFYSKDFSETPSGVPRRTPPTTTASADSHNHRHSGVLRNEKRRRVIEVIPEPIIRHNHMLGHMWRAEGNIDFDYDNNNNEEDDVESGEKVLKVNKYIHPVLLEKDVVFPGKSILDIADDQESLSLPLTSSVGTVSARVALPHQTTTRTTNLVREADAGAFTKMQEPDTVAIV